MPSKKKTIIEETIPDNASIPELGVRESVTWETEEDVILERIKAQYGETAAVKIKVYKIIAGKGDPVFVFSSTENVDEEILQETYGGGKYALRIFIDGILKHTHFMEVADKPISKQANNNNGDSREQMLREQMAWNQRLLLTILGKPQPIAQQTPLTELVNAANLIKGNGGSNNMDAMITLFTKGLEIGSGKSGDMDWKTALVNTIKEIAPVVTGAIAQVKGGVPMPNNGQVVTAQLLPEQELQKGITFLKGKIVAGLPVGLALDWVVSNAHEYMQFISLAMSKSFEEIVKIDPELANEPYNSWVRQFLEGLKEHFKESATMDDNEQEVS